MPIDAGKLNHRITILRLSRSYNDANQPVESWIALRTVYAGVRRATATERLAAGQVSAQVTDIFEVRREPEIEAIDAKDRLRHAGREYDIIEVSDLDRDGLLIRAAARADR